MLLAALPAKYYRDMSRFKRLQVLNTFVGTGIVPLFYNKDAELVKNVVKACYKGGARVFEFTNRGDYAHEVFAEVNKWCATECPEMIMGVGSVSDPATAALYIQLGAGFIVSPSLNPDMAKIFPGTEVGGPSFVKAIKGPCPWTEIMPSGGVSPEPASLEAWFKAGVACVGLGSQLTPKDVIANGDFGFIETKIRECIEFVKKIR